MLKRPTRKEVAKLAGVSCSTVHYTFNEERSSIISPATRAKVEKAAKVLGYTPSRAARAFKTGKFNTIGVMLFDIRAPYEQMLIGHLQGLIHKIGYDTMIVDGTDIREQKNFTYVLHWPVDGIIMCWPEEIHIEMAKQINKPLVGFGHSQLYKNVDLVQVNHFRPSCDVIEHLFMQGCESIAFLQNIEASESDARILVYKSIVKKYNLPEQIYTLEQTGRYPTYEQCLKIFSNNKPPQGIFCHNDELAIALQRAMHDLGYKIPEDMAIVGYDGLLESDYTYPRITTVISPVEEICESLVELMMRRIKEPDSEYKIIELEGNLEIRESSLIPLKSAMV